MKNIQNKNKEEKRYNKKIIVNQEKIKSIFRQYRSYRIIDKKSNYIAKLIEISVNDNISEITFSFVDGGIDLGALIYSKVFDYRKQNDLIQWILFQTLKGLETIHSLNIIHRDINPSHILISSKGEIKITGFGNSINDIESKFIEDKVVGQLSYIAPECLLKLNFNNKIDIWAVGILMIELYAKKNIFFRNQNNDSEESNEIKLFKQLQYLAGFFKIPFNFTEYDYFNNIEKITSWANNITFNEIQFNEIFENNNIIIEEDGLELLKKLLCFNYKERITCKEALKMPYFQSFQNFNKDEFKKNKLKTNSEDLSLFLKNLEKEFPKVNDLPNEAKKKRFNEELYKISQYKPKLNY